MTSTSPSFVLPADMSIYSAAEITSQWLNAPQAGSDRTIEAGAVENVDLAGIQILLAIQQEVTEAGGTFQLQNISPQLSGALTLLGLESLIGSGA